MSAHYLIPHDSRETLLPIYQLVPDSTRAWHAGHSRWHQYARLNASSLGIEIVDLGYPAEDEQLDPDARRWQPYTPQQIAASAPSVGSWSPATAFRLPRCWTTAMSPPSANKIPPPLPLAPALSDIRGRRLAR